MNTDLMHMMHHQRHQKLWAETEHERVKHHCASAPTAQIWARLTTWLRRFDTRRMRGVKLMDRSA
jgi:hypothetical protein